METVKDIFGLQCPACHDDTGFTIDIVIETTARLSVDGTDDDGGDHEWTDESGLRCDCGWSGKVKDANSWR